MNRVRQGSAYQPILNMITLVAVLQQCYSINLVSVPECESQQVLIYNNPSQSITSTHTHIFTITFSSSFANQPSVALGIAGYTSNDLFRLEYWSISQQIINNYTAIKISMRVQNSTAIYKLYLNYFAADVTDIAPTLFDFYYQMYEPSQLVNTSRSSGAKTDKLIYRPNPLHQFTLSSFVFCFTKALYMNSSSSSSFQFTVSCNLNLETDNLHQTFTNSISIVVSAIDNIMFLKLAFGMVVVNPNAISGDNFYQAYIGSATLTSTARSLDIPELNVSHGSTTIATMPVSDMQTAGFINVFSSVGTSTTVVISFEWQFTSSSSGSLLRITNPNGHRSLYYRFLIFGRVNCTYWSFASQQCVTSCGLAETHGVRDTICRACLSPCRTCSFDVRNCSSCPSSYFLHNGNCLTCQQVIIYQIQDLLPSCETKTPETGAPPFWLFALVIFPILAIATFCYYRWKKSQQIVNSEKIPTFREHPSIQL